MAIIEVSKQITNYLDSEQTASAPAHPVEGQRWTDTSKSPPVAMIYTEGEWKPERLSVEVLDPDFYQDLEDTKTEVAAAIEKAEAAEKAGKDAQAAGEAAQSAASEAKQAGENAANLATQAALDAQAAKDKADAVQIDVNGLVSDVAAINGTVTAISSKANEAYEKAAAVEGRTATLETSVTGLTGRMTDIETTSTSTTKKLNELVVTVDGQKQTLATVTTTADSALSKANVIETKVDGVTQTITSIENQLNQIPDGNRNLLLNSSFYTDSEKWGLSSGLNPYFNGQYLRIDKNQTSSTRLTISSGTSWLSGKVQKNKYYSLGIMYYVESVGNAGSSNNIFLRNQLNTGFQDKPLAELDLSITGKWIWLSKTDLSWNEDFTLSSFTIALGQTTIAAIRFKEVILVEGRNVKEWSPAPEDLATVSKVNQIATTVDGTIQTISSVKSTADSALAKATQVETTANGLKTTISNVDTTANSALTKATQVEATASGLTSTVSSIQTNFANQTSSDRNLFLSSDTVYENGSYNIASYDMTEKMSLNVDYVMRMKFTKAQTKGWVGAWLDGGSISLGRFTDAGDGTWYMRFKGKEGSRTTSRIFIYVGDSSAVGISKLEWIKIVNSNTMFTNWTPAPEDLATSSQFTQLSDQMNFKLTSADGGVTQIDMQNQIVTISSENIYLTGKSNISDAIIKTAHIADLAVSNGKIANLAVTEGKIGNLAVTTAKIADLAVNNAKIASLDAAKINTGYLAAARIAASSITTDKLNVATLSAITADLGNVTAGTINGVEIIGGSYTQSATLVDPVSGTSGTSKMTLAYGVFTNDFQTASGGFGRTTTLTSGVLRFFYNTGSGNEEYGRIYSNPTASDNGFVVRAPDTLSLEGGRRAYLYAPTIGITAVNSGDIDLGANGTYAGNTYRGYTIDAGTNTGNYIGFNRNSSDKMNFFVGKTADGTKRMGSDDLYDSSGSGKALHITSGGSIVAYSSSERFKEYIETAADVNPKSLLNLELKSWIYKSSHSLVSVGEPIRRVYGLIAEDVERVGLNQYVERDINGRVEGYKPELWTVTIPILKEHEESIETLKQKVQKLEEKIEALQAA